jgi:aminocarboxymuconate-semialdehyde decarboxylase
LALLEELGMLTLDPKTGHKQVNESGGEFGYKYEISDIMWNIPGRLKTMDKLGVNVDLLSIGNPWLSYIPKNRAAAVARTLNTELSATVKTNPRRFAAMGVVPVTTDDVLEELDYAVNELDLKGFMVGTHVNGKSIVSDEFMQIFERASQLGVPVYIHPLARPDAFRYHDRGTATSLIFPTETAVFAKSAVEKRLSNRNPKLRVVLAHLGGSVPLLLGRLDRAISAAKPAEAGVHELFKSFYLDSVTYFAPALKYVAGIWGAGKIMFGTDYPHAWGDNFERTVEVITSSGLANNEQELIFAENATKLFKL